MVYMIYIIKCISTNSYWIFSDETGNGCSILQKYPSLDDILTIESRASSFIDVNDYINFAAKIHNYNPKNFKVINKFTRKTHPELFI